MKNKKALVLLLSANIISGFAQGISMLSIPWYFAKILNRTSTFGMIYLGVTMISIFWGLYAGTLIDRFSRKRVFMGINITGGIILGSVAIIGYYLHYVPIALIVVVFASTIFIYNIHYPTLYAFGQEITEKINYSRINSYIEIQGQGTTMLAGAFGAILLSGTHHHMANLLGIHVHLPFDIARWPLYKIFLMDGITYCIALVLVSLIVYTPTETTIIHTGKIVERIKMGLDYLKQNTLLFLFGVVTTSIFIALIVEEYLLLPLYVSHHLQKGADVYASSGVYYTMGAILAGLTIRIIFKKTNTVKAISMLMVVTVGIFMLCAFSRNVLLFFAFCLLIGITNAGTRILRITYLFECIPNNVMGRTGSVFSVISTLTRALFILLFSAPFFAVGSNITWAYFIDGVFVFLCLLPLLYNYKKLTAMEIHHS